MIAGSCLSAREASAAMALVTAATEPDCEIIAFSGWSRRLRRHARWRRAGYYPGRPVPRMRLDSVIEKVRAIPMGGTDCALPLVWARRNKPRVSAFVTYTDSETWAGNIHPAQALAQYRAEFVGNAKAIVVGMTSNGFHPGRPERPRHAGRGRFRHQRASRHLGLCAGGVMTLTRVAGSRMQRVARRAEAHASARFLSKS